MADDLRPAVDGRTSLTYSFGEHLVDELSARGIPRRMLCRPLGMTAAEVDDLIGGHRELTGDLAARLGAFLGTSGRLWLNLAATSPTPSSPAEQGGGDNQ